MTKDAKLSGLPKAIQLHFRQQATMHSAQGCQTFMYVKRAVLGGFGPKKATPAEILGNKQQCTVLKAAKRLCT